MLTDFYRIRNALSSISAQDRDTWLKMGMAIHAELGEAGFDMWDAWSQSADSYNTRDARAVWKGFKSSGATTIATLFHEAKQQGWRDLNTNAIYTPHDLKPQEVTQGPTKQVTATEAEIAQEHANTTKKLLLCGKWPRKQRSTIPT
jgi:putative DNA primase/helicase